MFKVEDVLTLKEDERVRSVVRRHPLKLVLPLGLALLFIVIPFFLLFPLFNWGLPGILIFSASLLIGICIALRALVLWDANTFIITTLRIVSVDQRSLLTRVVTELPLISIQDVSWSRDGILENLFRMGSISVQTVGGTTPLGFGRIPRPRDVLELLNEVRLAVAPIGPAPTATPEKSGTDGPKKLQAIVSMLESYSDVELQRVEAVLKARERTVASESFFAKEEEHAEPHDDAPKA